MCFTINLFGAGIGVRREELTAFAGSYSVNVVDYGAQPWIPVNITDGSYPTNRYSLPDNATAIQAALDAAYASRGVSNTVFFPKGIYQIGSPVTVPPGIHIKGVGSLHAGDFGTAVQFQDTNAYSVIWQTNLTRGGIAFRNLEKENSTISSIEICGHTNPLAWAESGYRAMDVAPSTVLANGPGLFFGNSSVTDWETTATAGAGYSGDIQVFNVTVSGFKLGVRATANSANYYRMHMVACDTGFANSQLCCGADQTIFNTCSVALRPNGIGYDINGVAGGGRGMVFLSPSDYRIGTWLKMNEGSVTVHGGNLEMTHGSTTRTNFIELYGLTDTVTMMGTRVQYNGAWTSFINYFTYSLSGPRVTLDGVILQSPTVYANSAKNAGLPDSWPCLVRCKPFNSGQISVRGGIEGWIVVTDDDAARTVLLTIPLFQDSCFAGPAYQAQGYWGNGNAYANQNNKMQTYGRVQVMRGTPDYVEVKLADDPDGPIGTYRVILSEPTYANNGPAANTIKVDGIRVNTDAQVLGSDNLTLSIANYSQFYVWSDNATPANRTFNLPGPTNGKQLTLVWIQGGTGGQLVDNAANSTGPGITLLNGNWEPTTGYATLHLVGVNDNWVEVSRSTN